MAKNYTSPLLQKYQKQYEKDPTSRVFAPLAETYRKLGMIDRAIEILREGIKHHPDYVMGYVGLAACYIEKDQWEQAYTSLRPFVAKYRDNLRLQKLFAQTCLTLGHREEALETYKYLLFMNPKDKEAAQKVRELEEEIERGKVSFHEKRELDKDDEAEGDKLFDVEDLESAPSESIYNDEIEGWQTVDFSESKESGTSDDEEVIEWDIEQPPQVTVNSYSDAGENIEEKTELDLENESQDSPVITHTLVDMYISRGHIDKAREILLKILELNPGNEETKNKLAEIDELIGETSSEGGPEREKVVSLYPEESDEGHRDLLSNFDQQVQRGSRGKQQRKKERLEIFLAKLKDKSQKHRSEKR